MAEHESSLAVLVDFENMARPGAKGRGDFDIHLVLNRLAEDMPGRVLEKPTILGVEKLDDSGVTIRSIVKTPPFKNADVLREWRRRIIEEFDRSGIRFVQKEGIAGRPS